MLGLENLESEVPVFPSIRVSTGQLGQQSQVSLPEYFPPMDLAQERKENLQTETGFGTEEKSDLFGFPTVVDFSEPEEEESVKLEKRAKPNSPVHLRSRMLTREPGGDRGS
ncbi:MAG: hypothetical protein Ct9H90mP26_1920 [Methanobacteriota archaeon]|nr:MAG: hypothetical protein Ct9H90mP26_1920 [Euryarchaeota archaeon]